MLANGNRFQRPLFGLLTMLSACSPETKATSERSGPTLEMLETVVLSESDSFLLTQPSGLAVTQRADRFIVSDVASGRVLRWRADGQPNGSWGRAGSGPGELSGPGGVIWSGASIWVLDFGSRSWKQLDASSGTQLSTIPFSGAPSNSVPSEFTDSLWVGLRVDATHTALGLLLPGADSVAQFVRLPSEYDSLGPVGIGRLTTIIRVRSGPTTIVGFGALNGIYILSEDTVVSDSVVIPATRRRGMRAQTIRASNGDFAALMNGISVLTHAGAATRAGRVITVHYDPTVTGTDRPRITAKVFVSILDFANRQACVDTEVAATGDARPLVQLVGDTLFVLRQSMTGNDVKTQVDSYRVSDASCNWLPLRGGALIDP